MYEESINISNNPCLQYIKIESYSFQNVPSLTISNNTVLSAIRFEIMVFSDTTTSFTMTSS